MKEVYDLKSVKMPYMAGGLLKLFVSLVEGPLRGLLAANLFETAGITWLRKQVYEEAPTFYPVHFTGAPHEKAAALPQDEWPRETAKPRGFQYPTVRDYAEAYRSRKTAPEEVAKKVLDAIEASNAGDSPLRAVVASHREDVLKQARESTQRIKEGRALSIFDGVPIAVKEELDVAGYPTTVGTAFLGKSKDQPAVELRAERDAEVVARLRAAGALIVGKTNMHEIGIGVTGLNPHHGTARNPYNPNHFTGGSSSGSGAAVAAGLVPVAIGADGGGSIRIPSSLCGLVGLKSTFGRVSEFGAAPLCWSVAHIGPLAWSAADAALTYAVIAGPDLKDPMSLHQPLPSLEGWDQVDLHGLRIGVFWRWFRHAEMDVVRACEAMLEKFKSMGAEICEIAIPDLEANRVAHVITITSEMVSELNKTAREHNHEHGLDVRLNLALARQFTATDYVLSQRVRTRVINHFKEAFKQVDVILTPTTGVAAPAINPAALPDGDSDLTTLTEIMRFATAPNMTGLPAISFPVGCTPKGLPVGMQAIGRAWDEATLLRMALAAEQVVERNAPQVQFKILD